MTDNLIEIIANAIADLSETYCKSFVEEAHAVLAAIDAAGYDLVLRQHRDMGPGFTHHDGPTCPCGAVPKVEA